MQLTTLVRSGQRSGSGGSDLQWEGAVPPVSAPTEPAQSTHSGRSPDDEVIEWEDLPPAASAQQAPAAAGADQVSARARADGPKPAEQSHPQPMNPADDGELQTMLL
jgi:hypothetical protein